MIKLDKKKPLDLLNVFLVVFLVNVSSFPSNYDYISRHLKTWNEMICRSRISCEQF